MVDFEKLNKQFDSILGDSGSLDGAAEQEEPRGGVAVDDAFAEPEYDGTGPETEDPRDPTTFNEPGEEPEDDGTEPPPDEDGEPEPEISPEGGNAGDADEYEYIPEHLVTAGRQAGLSDEEIMRLDTENPNALEALSGAYQKTVTLLDEAGRPEEAMTLPLDEVATEEQTPLEKLNLNLDVLELDDNVAHAIAPIRDAFNGLIEHVGKLEGELKDARGGVDSLRQSQEADSTRRIDEYFDGASKDTPELGVSSKGLSQTESDNRIFAWTIAKAMHNESDGQVPMSRGMEIGLSALKGQVKEQKMKAKLVGDLNRRRSKFSPRPRGTRGRAAPPRSEQERSLEAINNILDKNY